MLGDRDLVAVVRADGLQVDHGQVSCLNGARAFELSGAVTGEGLRAPSSLVPQRQQARKRRVSGRVPIRPEGVRRFMRINPSHLLGCGA